MGMILVNLLAGSLLAVTIETAQAQTFTVLHSFTGGADGALPSAGLTQDLAGNLYGTTTLGGMNHGGDCYDAGCGIVFKLMSTGSDWILSPLHAFGQFPDGNYPLSRVTFGPDGAFYGTTAQGGQSGQGCSAGGCGTVFKLNPQSTARAASLAAWRDKIIYPFGGDPDGYGTCCGDVVFDRAGILYGTTWNGGASELGTIYELVPSGTDWTEKVLYSFTGGDDGAWPFGSVILDQAGSLYGVTYKGGSYSWGTIFQLKWSGTNWTLTTLYAFKGEADGGFPIGGLILDQLGNLFGSTSTLGPGGGGVVFVLSPSNGIWTLTPIYAFTGNQGPGSNLTRDAVGNLYGTTSADGVYGLGSVFKLTTAGGTRSYIGLHDFTGGTDGGQPSGGVTINADGNLYGTAQSGGANGYGVVWKIAP